MRSLKISLVAVFAMAGLVALIPASAMAAPHAVVTFGKVATTAINSHGVGSFVVTTPAVPAKSVTVHVNKNTKMLPLTAAANSAGFIATDAIWASGGVGKHQYASTVKYDIAPFAIPYAKHPFNGKYVSSGTGTLVIKNKAGKSLTFTINAKTVYRLNGKKVASPPTYKMGERMTVYGHEFTDGSWLAHRVDIFSK
jgi:Domain of unknown function (DUF5666)